MTAPDGCSRSGSTEENSSNRDPLESEESDEPPEIGNFPKNRTLLFAGLFEERDSSARHLLI